MAQDGSLQRADDYLHDGSSRTASNVLPEGPRLPERRPRVAMGPPEEVTRRPTSFKHARNSMFLPSRAFASYNLPMPQDA
eukprot:8216927-Pyramimonas_sp.AAC.1